MFELIEIIGLCAGFCTAFAVIPQINKIIKNKSTRDISYLMYLMSLVGNGLWIWYGLVKYSIALVIATSINFCLLGSVIVMKYMWERILEVEE